MCDICGCYPCLSGCPNAPDPPEVYRCKHCDEPIVVGDEYYEMDGDHWHRECFEDIAVSLLLEIGATLSEASANDIDDGSDDAYEAMRDARLFDD